VGEQVGLTLIHGNSSQHAVVKMLAEPIAASRYFTLLNDMLVSALAAVFALVIAFKQPESKGYRALVLFFLCQGFNHNFSFTPGGTLHVITDLTCFGTVSLIGYFGALFAIYYPANKPVGLRATLARFVAIFNVLTLAVSVYSIWVLTSRSVFEENYVQSLYWLLAAAMTLTALLDGWRKSIGGERQRYQWLLLSIGTSTLFTFLITVPGMDIFTNGYFSKIIVIPYQASLLFMEFGIAYSVLRHRVFNFGFAVNRAIFYSATTLILLIAFGIVEWLSEQFLHFEGREANVLIDGGIALGVYLAFHKLRHVFEHWLETVFFHKWHANEAKLRQFVKHAAHISTTEALLSG
ncbi:MAG TPA: hypothetical protein VK832_16820, partial [Burkholderiaceae bacterium]|nr:hypothetical protein [Burkholderiaceae bacterium]